MYVIDEQKSPIKVLVLGMLKINNFCYRLIDYFLSLIDYNQLKRDKWTAETEINV